MSISDKINKYIINEIKQGKTLSQIQSSLATEFDCSMTYMDLRMLVADLESISWETAKVEAPEEKEIVKKESDPGTVVTVNSIVQPGYQMSGEVKFKSGSEGMWYVDTMGQPGLSLKSELQPTEEDIREFQIELQRILTGQ
jgi:hypothetical protein